MKRNYISENYINEAGFGVGVGDVAGAAAGMALPILAGMGPIFVGLALGTAGAKLWGKYKDLQSLYGSCEQLMPDFGKGKGKGFRSKISKDTLKVLQCKVKKEKMLQQALNKMMSACTPKIHRNPDRCKNKLAGRVQGSIKRENKLRKKMSDAQERAMFARAAGQKV